MHVSSCDGAWPGRRTAQGEDRYAAGTGSVGLTALGRKRQAHVEHPPRKIQSVANLTHPGSGRLVLEGVMLTTGGCGRKNTTTLRTVRRSIVPFRTLTEILSNIQPAAVTEASAALSERNTERQGSPRDSAEEDEHGQVNPSSCQGPPGALCGRRQCLRPSRAPFGSLQSSCRQTAEHSQSRQCKRGVMLDQEASCPICTGSNLAWV